MKNKTFPYSVERWSLVNENKEYKTPIFDLLKRKFQLVSEARVGDFYILDSPEWVNIIALTPEREVILVEQFRFGIQEPTLEIPGGMADRGESLLEASKREFLEETGYVSDRWEKIGVVSSNPAIHDNHTHCFLAENCVFKGTQNPDQHERIEVHTLPLKQLYDHIRDGTIHHAIVLAAFSLFILRQNLDPERI